MTAQRRRGGYRTKAEDLVPMAWHDPWTPTHRQLVALWLEIAHGLGYLVTVTHDSRTDHWGADSGWPDVFAARDGRAYAIEIKVPPDVPTDEQRAWLERLGAVPGITEGVFRSCGDKARDMTVIADILRSAPPVVPRGTRPAEGHL
jgi:hypothetical protein